MSHGTMHTIHTKKTLFPLKEIQIYNLCDKNQDVMNWVSIKSEANKLACTNDRQI
jgi:hypothetical protein